MEFWKALTNTIRSGFILERLGWNEPLRLHHFQKKAIENTTRYLQAYKMLTGRDLGVADTLLLRSRILARCLGPWAFGPRVKVLICNTLFSSMRLFVVNMVVLTFLMGNLFSQSAQEKEHLSCNQPSGISRPLFFLL